MCWSGSRVSLGNVEDMCFEEPFASIWCTKMKRNYLIDLHIFACQYSHWFEFKLFILLRGLRRHIQIATPTKHANMTKQPLTAISTIQVSSNPKIVFSDWSVIIITLITLMKFLINFYQLTFTISTSWFIRIVWTMIHLEIIYH